MMKCYCLIILCTILITNIIGLPIDQLLTLSTSETTSKAIISPFLNVKYTTINSKIETLTTICLECICNDYVGMDCDINEICANDIDNCDLLGISREYWTKAGNITAEGVLNTDPMAFVKCKRSPKCSGQTILAYMMKYEENCNSERKVMKTCQDYAAVHFYGYNENCETTEMHQRRQNRFENCFEKKVAAKVKNTKPKAKKSRAIQNPKSKS